MTASPTARRMSLLPLPAAAPRPADARILDMDGARDGWVLEQKGGRSLVRSAGYSDLEGEAVRADSRHDAWRPSADVKRDGSASVSGCAEAGSAPRKLDSWLADYMAKLDAVDV